MNVSATFGKQKRKVPAFFFFWGCCSCFLFLTASLFFFLLFFFVPPQGDGQTRNHDTVTPGHHNGQRAARGVVPNAAPTTHNGSGLNPKNGHRAVFCFFSGGENKIHLPHPCTLKGLWTSGAKWSEGTAREEVRRWKWNAALLRTSILFLKKNKKNPQDLDVAADSMKLLLAQTEASSSYPVLFFFNISLSVLRRLTCKAVHKQNGFQLSFCCFGLDLNRMCFVFAHVYACVCARVRVWVCTRVCVFLAWMQQHGFFFIYSR